MMTFYFHTMKHTYEFQNKNYFLEKATKFDLTSINNLFIIRRQIMHQIPFLHYMYKIIKPTFFLNREILFIHPKGDHFNSLTMEIMQTWQRITMCFIVKRLVMC
jgi:hypothetical protein